MKQTPIHFQANFLPKVHKFKVELKTPDRRWVELMTVARFLRFARDENAPLVIGGIKVEMGEGEAFKIVRSYFKKVADSYVDTHYKQN